MVFGEHTDSDVAETDAIALQHNLSKGFSRVSFVRTYLVFASIQNRTDSRLSETI